MVQTMDRIILRAQNRLASLGKPHFLGFSDRPFPFMPWGNRLLALRKGLVEEGLVVWYAVVEEDGQKWVPFSLEVGRGG